MKIKKNNKKEKEIIKVMPVSTTSQEGEIEVNYYTKEGKEIPTDCVGKTIVNVYSFFDNE